MRLAASVSSRSRNLLRSLGNHIPGSKKSAGMLHAMSISKQVEDRGKDPVHPDTGSWRRPCDEAAEHRGSMQGRGAAARVQACGTESRHDIETEEAWR